MYRSSSLGGPAGQVRSSPFGAFVVQSAPQGEALAEERSVEGRIQIAQRLSLAEALRPGGFGEGVRCGSHRVVGRIDTRHEGTEPTSGLEDPGGFQFAVGPGHGVHREPDLAGEIADRRQPGTRCEPTVTHTIDDLRAQLIEQRGCGLMIQPHPFPQTSHVPSMSHAR